MMFKYYERTKPNMFGDVAGTKKTEQHEHIPIGDVRCSVVCNQVKQLAFQKKKKFFF